MSPSDIAALNSLAGRVTLDGALIAAVFGLIWFARWLLMKLLESKDQAIAYRDGENGRLHGQVERQQDQLDRNQDLFDQALELLAQQPPRRGGGRTA